MWSKVIERIGMVVDALRGKEPTPVTQTPTATRPSDEAVDKVRKIWGGDDPNIISAKRCKARVRRAWPTLAMALDELDS